MNSCIQKQHKIKELFTPLTTPESRYERIITLGKTLAPYPAQLKVEPFQVPGCQSLMYLHANLQEERLQLLAHSDALISAGLAALLLFAYHDEPPASIFTHPPHYLRDLGIASSLSPGRSNGLASLVQVLQQRALPFLAKI